MATELTSVVQALVAARDRSRTVNDTSWQLPFSRTRRCHHPAMRVRSGRGHDALKGQGRNGMRIPQFDEQGLLPPGVWDCSLIEIEERFLLNDHRRELWRGLLQFMIDVYHPLALPIPILIDGSFCRSKAVPSDIDVVLDVSGLVDSETAIKAVMALRLHHDEIKERYHVDVWLRHPAIPNDFAVFFQYLGDKGAAELQRKPTDPKGILRVSP